MYNWRPPSLSELTPIIIKMELTHLISDTSNYYDNFVFLSINIHEISMFNEFYTFHLKFI